MPDEAVDLGQVDARLGAVVVDEAQLDPLGHLAEQGEVDAAAVVGGAEGVGRSGPDLHWLPSVCGHEGQRRCWAPGRARGARPGSEVNLPARGDGAKTPSQAGRGVRQPRWVGSPRRRGRPARPRRTDRPEEPACPPSESPSSPERPEASARPPPSGWPATGSPSAVLDLDEARLRGRGRTDPGRRWPRPRRGGRRHRRRAGRGRRRPGRRRAGPAGRARQQRRHHPRQPHLQDDRGRLGRRHGRAPQGRLPHDQGLPGAHDRARSTAASSTSRPRRRRATAARPTTRRPRPGLQGFTKTLAIELGQVRRHRERRRAGLHPDRHDGGDRRADRGAVRGLPRPLGLRRSPSAGSASPRTSPRRSPSSCPRRPASSPARSSTSPAARSTDD